MLIIHKCNNLRGPRAMRRMSLLAKDNAWTQPPESEVDGLGYDNEGLEIEEEINAIADKEKEKMEMKEIEEP